MTTTDMEQTDLQALAELEQHLEVGGGAFLDLNPRGGQDRRYRTSIQGWDPQRRIVLKRPAACRAISMNKGRLCSVRFVEEGDIWGFVTKLASDIHPFGDDDTIIVAWPQRVRRMRVRQHQRVSVSLACRVAFQDGNTEEGSLRDLSAGGCGLRVSRTLDIAESLEITFPLPDTGEMVSRAATVRNRGNIDPDGFLEYGCQFTNEKDEIQYSIEFYVARTLAESRGEMPPNPQVIVVSTQVEDTQDARHALRTTGFDVVPATGILDLGRRLHGGSPAAILVSASLPEIEPALACSLIRKTPGFAELPLVVFGGDIGLEQPAKDAGANAWIPTAAKVATVATLFTPPRK